MVILSRSYGDHSNRLFQNVRLETFCMEHNIEFKNTTLSDLAQYYNDPSSSEYIGISQFLTNKYISFLLKKLRIFNVISLDKRSSLEKLKTCTKKNCYVEGWQYNGVYYTDKYHDKMIEKYSLKETYYQNNPFYHELLSIDRSKTAVIGIHIRKGDYKTWKKGVHYYEDDTYASFMHDMENLIRERENKSALFIIFSNVETSFKPSDTLWLSKNTWYMDHFLMAKCDYLIGPPSTFTMWASYIGKTKYLHMMDASQKVQLEDFRYWTVGDQDV